ncbi:hypothetical protein SE23_16405 [Vibrio sinaloensis]|nr:hypothetical protein SE23_16405 [Vibrio sinaloensis]
MNRLLLAILPLVITGCNNSSSNGSNTTTKPSTKPTTQTTVVKVFPSVENCSTAADVPNCALEKGVYVLKTGSTVTDEQHQRVITQAKNFVNWASEPVRQQLNQKTLVIGIMKDQPDVEAGEGQFVIALSQAKKIADGVELVYTNIDGSDETQGSTTYQKLMQLFDYYVDENQNHALGQGLNNAYSSFKQLLITQDSEAKLNNHEALRFDECPYGNGQLSTSKNDRALGTETPCKPEEGEDLAPNGVEDPIHAISGVNMNPGSLLGLMYEYKVDPKINEGGGELSGSKGNEFKNIGNIGSGKLDGNSHEMFISWANPAFAPLNIYLDTYFFANKK